MIDTLAFLWAGAALMAVAFFFWGVSLIRNDVSIVDSLWSLMFLMIAVIYAWLSETAGPRQTLVLVLTSLWALRLSAYITWRNHAEDEDYRYQEIRRNNEPGFRYKSLYIVFIFQAFLAWVISLPLVVAISSTEELNLLDFLGIGLWTIGFLFEALGDLQLTRFKSNPANRGKVLDKGLWSLSRHPNYFGNFTLWWGFFLISLSAGNLWAIVSPILMSFLLLKVSGVALLEKDISDRRPEYRDYIRRTNSFFPGPQRR
jgi:steroid 5-alpha reductase family enzyme